MTNAMPSHFDHYEVAGLLGSGQYGNVYLARDKKLWRWVMLKVLHSHVAANKQRCSISFPFLLITENKSINK